MCYRDSFQRLIDEASVRRGQQHPTDYTDESTRLNVAIQNWQHISFGDVYPKDIADKALESVSFVQQRPRGWKENERLLRGR